MFCMVHQKVTFSAVFIKKQQHNQAFQKLCIEMNDFSKVEFLQVVQDLFEEIRDVFPVQVRYVTLPINSADTCMFEQLLNHWKLPAMCVQL